MKLLLILCTLFAMSTSAFSWASDEEVNPTPHEEYETPKAEYWVQEIAGMLIQDIQVKYVIKSNRGKDFVRDLHGSTEVSLPRGMYRIVGDGVSPITTFEAEDSRKMIIDYYVWESISYKDNQKAVAKTIYGHENNNEVTKADFDDMKAEIEKHKKYFKWFRYYYDRLNSGEVFPEEVLLQDDFYKAVEAGTIVLEME